MDFSVIQALSSETDPVSPPRVTPRPSFPELGVVKFLAESAVDLQERLSRFIQHFSVSVGTFQGIWFHAVQPLKPELFVNLPRWS